MWGGEASENALEDEDEEEGGANEGLVVLNRVGDVIAHCTMEV